MDALDSHLYHFVDSFAGCVLTESDVHVWCVPLEASSDAAAQFESVLSSDEIARADRFRTVELRQTFVIGRGTLRYLLAYYTDREPGDIEFSYGEYGKPALTPARPERFNLSHAGGLGLYAIGLNRDLGIDIEHHRDMGDMEQIAARFFSPEEAQALLSMPAEDRKAAFFRCWTRKEAFLKATGRGFSVPLDSFVVEFRDGWQPAVLRPSDGDLEPWEMFDVTPVSDCSAALVTTGVDPLLSYARVDAAEEIIHMWEQRPDANLEA